jgi:cobalt-zinc-cadmium efflux system membrane fusion protein
MFTQFIHSSLLIRTVVLVLYAASILASCKKSESKSEVKTEAAAKVDEKHDEHDHKDKIELTSEQAKMAGIMLGKAEWKPLASVVKANGMLDAPPQNVVSVSPRLGGFVKSTPLLEGMRVRKGQTLAVLENQDFIILQQDYWESRHRLDFAEAEYKRQEIMRQSGTSAAQQFQESARDYRSLQSRVAALEQRLQLLGIAAKNLSATDIRPTSSIVAPIDGFVTRVNISLGRFVNIGEEICRIVDTRHLHVELQVFEKDIPALRVGQRVRVLLVNEGTERLGKIYLLGREISAERTVRIHVHLSKEDHDLRPNTALSAWIETEAKPVMTVPDEAIVSADGKDYIFIQSETNDKKRTFAKVHIRRGIAVDGVTEIIVAENFDRATLIILKGASSLLAQMQNAEGG